MKKITITNKTTLALFIILIIASFFRLSNIKTIPPGLYPDEAINGNNALEALRTNTYKVFYPENNGREGLFINIQALFLKFFLNFYENPEPWMLRIVSAIFGILTVLGLYFLTKQLFNKKIALLSSFLLAVGFWPVNFSRIGFRAIMVPFCLTWAIYFLLKALEKNNWKFIIFSGIFFGAGFHTYIAYRIAPLIALIILIYYFFNYQRQKNIKDFWKLIIIWTITTFIIALPIGIYFLENPQDFMGRSTQVSVFNSAHPLKEFSLSFIKTIGMFNFYGDCNWRHNYACQKELDFLTGIFFILGLIVTIKKLAKKPFDFSSGLIVGWFLIMTLPAILTFEGIPHALRSIGLIPPVFILAGVGLYSFCHWCFIKIPSQKRKNISIIILSLILLLIFLINYFNYFQKWAKNPNVSNAFNENYEQIGEYLNSLPPSLNKFVLVNAGGVLVNNIPMSAQTVMFITNTYHPNNQIKKNIFYLTPENLNEIILLNDINAPFIIIPLEKNTDAKQIIESIFPNISFKENPYFWIFQSL